MSTSILKIKNGEVIESQCKSNTDLTVASASDENVSDISTLNMENYKCTDRWIKYENIRIYQTWDIQEFLTHEEAETACIELPIDDCASIEEYRGNKDSVVFNLKRWTLLATNDLYRLYTTYIRPRCRSDG